jgi:hypothetical protein
VPYKGKVNYSPLVGDLGTDDNDQLEGLAEECECCGRPAPGTEKPRVTWVSGTYRIHTRAGSCRLVLRLREDKPKLQALFVR